MPDKGGFAHFMLKEIYEQPRAVRDTTRALLSPDQARIKLNSVRFTADELRAFRRVNILASGTSRHAGMAAEYMIHELAALPVDVDFASEFEYRNPMTGPADLTIAITQSGETADTSGAQREAKSKGSRTLAISNVADSTITREADAAIYLQAGPEISIASTKAFTAQLTALFLLALYLGEVRETLKPDRLQWWLGELRRIPERLTATLDCDPQCDDLAARYFRANDFLYLGRGIHYPVALDGALKLKEVSYIHAEGYPAGEMKHGPNALIDESLPVVILAARDEHDSGSMLRYEKTLSNLKEVTARDGQAIVVATAGDTNIADFADQVIWIPPAPELLLPILEIVPLQLLAYHIAVRRGVDVDHPRNLVKSVTTE